MKTMTVYQTDPATGAFMYQTVANEIPLQPGEFNIPDSCVETAPPTVTAGHVAQWSNGAWQEVQDNRSATLYVASTSCEYPIGSSVEVDSASVSYNGLGPVPAWLTTTAPAAQNPA